MVKTLTQAVKASDSGDILLNMEDNILEQLKPARAVQESLDRIVNDGVELEKWEFITIVETLRVSLDNVERVMKKGRK